MERSMNSNIWFGGFQHETNTFSPHPTTFDDFLKTGAYPAFSQGTTLFTVLEGMNTPITGFLSAFNDRSQLQPISWGAAVPKGLVTQEAYDRLTEAFFSCPVPPSAIYLDLHGAMVTETSRTPEADFVGRLRAQVGPHVPIIATLDFHANIAPQLFERTDSLIVYRTYPHVDMRERGRQAATELLSRLSESRTPPYKKYQRLPFLMNLPSQCTLLPGMKAVFERLAQLSSNTPCP